MVLSKMIIMIIGINMGKVNLRNVYQRLAPSTVAASNASLGRLLKPASKTNIEKGVHCQIDIAAMVYRAILGVHQLTFANPIVAKT